MNFNILQVWTVLDDKTDIGKNQLVKLAIRIHAAVANSADCERFFSQMGAIHTKRRSRLDPQVVRDLAVVKMSIQQEFKEDTLNQRKRKREEFEEAHPLASKRSRSSKMRSIPTQTADAATSAGPSATITHPDESEDTDTDETEGEEEVPMSTRALVTALTTAADGDDTADDMVSFDAGQLDPSLLSQLNGNPPTPTPTSASMPSPSPSLSNSDRHFFGTQQVSRIEDLFDFSEDTIEMWQDIGHYGEVRYQNEEEELENWSRESTAKLEDLG